MWLKNIYLGFVILILYLISLNGYLSVNATPASSVFTNAGISYSIVVGGDYNGFKIIDSIEKLYMIRYGMSDDYLIIKDLDFQDASSYINPDLSGDFNGDGTSSSILTELSTGSGWLPIGMNPDGTLPSPYTFSGDLIGSGLIEISNLVMNRTLELNSQGLGFFRALNTNTIENIAFTSVDYDIYSVNGLTSNPSVSILASSSKSITLRKVFIQGELSVTADSLPAIRVGGLISQSTNNLDTIDIEESIVNLEITINPNTYAAASTTFIGGFIGHHVSRVNIYNSAFIGSIDSGSPIGGIVSDSNASSSNTLRIVNSYVNATLTNRGGLSSTKGMGGLIAQVSAGGRDLDIANTYTTGELIQIHADDKRNTAGLIGADNVSSEHDRLFRNVLVAMSNDATKYKAFGFPWLGTTPNIRASEVTNSYIINDITISGVETSEANVIGVVNSINEAFSSGFQQSVIGSGSNVWSFEDNRMPLLYYSGTTTLMPFQTFRILRNGQLSTATSVNVIFNSNSNLGLITQQSITGNSISAPDVSKVGHELEGWYTDVNLTNLYDFNTLLSSDLTLYAKWTPVVNSHPDQGEPVVRELTTSYSLELDEPSITIDLGEEVVLPKASLIRTFGYVKTVMEEVEATQSVDSSNPGVYSIEYSTDYEGVTYATTLSVTVRDTNLPRLVINTPSVGFFNQAFNHDVEAYDGNIKLDVEIIGLINPMQLGSQRVTYQAVDSDGNEVSEVFTVTIRIPEVQTQTVMVNAQRLVFTMYEHLMDFASLVLYMAQAVMEPPVDSNQWEVYEEDREFVATGPGQRIYLMMMDALGNVISRESIELFWREPVEFTPRRIRGEVVYPEIEPTNYISWPLVGGISVGVMSIGGIIFMVIVPARRKKE